MIAAFFFVSAAAFAGEAPYSPTAPLGGVESPYTPLLSRKLEAWLALGPLQAPQDAAKAYESAAASPDAISFECFGTPAAGPDQSNETYVGVAQAMRVSAPLERVQAALEDFEHYKDLIPDVKEVKVRSRDRNRLRTAWEERVPVFFVPNVKFEMDYVTASPAPNRWVMRYQLSRKADLRFDDGFILLERDGQNTRYYEYDFWDADYGILKSFGVDRIWREGVESLYVSDAAIKLRAEHPELSFERIQDDAKRWLKKAPRSISDLVKARRPSWSP